jgi:hypothetical protein
MPVRDGQGGPGPGGQYLFVQKPAIGAPPISNGSRGECMGATQFKETVDNWNARYPIGKRVLVRRADGTVLETVTRSKALTHGGHAPVVFLRGVAGCCALSEVNPFTRPDPIQRTAPQIDIGSTSPGSRQPRARNDEARFLSQPCAQLLTRISRGGRGTGSLSKRPRLCFHYPP